MAEAGALPLLRKTGWLKLFRSEETFAEGRAAADKIAPFGLKTAFYDAGELRKLEPSLQGGVGAVHYLDPASISDPLALTQSYRATVRAARRPFFCAATPRPSGRPAPAMASRRSRGRCWRARR